MKTKLNLFCETTNPVGKNLTAKGRNSVGGLELAEGEQMISMCHYEGLNLGVEVAAKGVTCSTRRFDYRGATVTVSSSIPPPAAATTDVLLFAAAAQLSPLP